ncbi:MAG: tetratricopeptide repeat protein [Chloroflexi bacterium]|nr:tetratricopeptide repeat protein [Chloroflexota bacterium]
MDYQTLEWAGRWSEAITLAEHLLDQNPSTEQANELHVWLGGILWKVGRMVDSQSHLDAAHPNDLLLKARKLYEQGELYYIQHGVMKTLPDFDAALHAHQESLALRQEIGDKEGQSDSRSRLGVIYEQLGDHEKAKDYYTQSLLLAEEINYPHGQTRPLTHLGLFKLKDGEIEGAAEYLERALQINQEIGNIERLIFGHMNVGRLVLIRDNDHAAALEHFQQALKLSEQTGFKLGLVVAHMRLGLHFQGTGLAERAKQHFTTMRDIAIDCDYHVFEEQADLMLGASQ